MILNRKIIGSMIIASLGAVTLSSVYAASDNTATATAVIATAITIAAPTANLSWGTISASGVAGTATVNGAGTVSAGGGASVTGGTATAASFLIGGTNGANYTIDLTGSTNPLISGGNNMTVTYTAYAVNDDAGYAVAYSAPATLSGAGADTVHVGGQVTVGINQATGTYAGTLNVTVLYQ